MCGGVCGAGDWHRDFVADGHVSAGDTGGIVRGVTGFHCGKMGAEFDCAESQPEVIVCRLKVLSIPCGGVIQLQVIKSCCFNPGRRESATF
jgi:hypothetical protein